MREVTRAGALVLSLFCVAGCVSEEGAGELADIAADFPVLDDLSIESGERIEVVRSAGSETPGYEKAPNHDQRYIPNDGNDFDDVIVDLVAAVVTAGFVEVDENCYHATTDADEAYTARIYQFDENVTTPSVAHVRLDLTTGANCPPGT